MLIVVSTNQSSAKPPPTELAPEKVVNELAIYGASLVPANFLAPAKVVNDSVIHPQELVPIIVHTLSPAQLVNASTIYVQTVQKVAAPVTTSYDNPGGKGNRTATIAVTFDGTLGGSSFINNLVDGAFADTSADSCWWHTGQTGRKITFDFGTPKVIQEAKLYSSTTTSNGMWKWRGSQDGVGYTDLTPTFAFAGSAAGAVNGDLSANNIAYRFYQLFQVSGNTSNAWERELEFKISA